MATHSSILGWRILWTEEPGGLLSIGSHRVGHHWSNLACMHACIQSISIPSPQFCYEPKIAPKIVLTFKNYLNQFFSRLLPQWLRGKEPACNCRRHGKWRLDPWVGKIPGRRKWHPIPVFLPGESHGQSSLAGYSPWGCKRVRHDLVTKSKNLYLIYKNGSLNRIINLIHWGSSNKKNESHVTIS